jgi:hypothetical protein
VSARAGRGPRCKRRAHTTNASSSHVPGQYQPIPSTWFSLRESVAPLTDPMRGSIRDDDDHLCRVPPPLQVPQSYCHTRDNSFGTISTASGSEIVEKVVKLGGVGGERQCLGHVGVVLTGVITVGHNLIASSGTIGLSDLYSTATPQPCFYSPRL